MRSWWVWGLGCTAVCLAAPSAAADEMQGLRSDALVERDNSVSVTLDRGFAKLVVERSVFNGGERHDQATFWINLPNSAVATGLRTLGSLNGKPHWFAGDLMEAEAAAAKYQELTGVGGYYPKDPALLSWRQQDYLALQVFPCPPGQVKQVEYTLQMPLTYSQGSYLVELPSMGTEELPARIEVRAARSGDQLKLNGKAWQAGRRYQLPRDAATTLELVPTKAPRISGEFGQYVFAKQRVLTHFEFRLAPQLSKAPKGASVVLLIDASKSMGSRSSAASDAARAYLSYVPDAQVQLVYFNRKAEERFKSWVGVERARVDLSAYSPKLANGSELGDALDTADRLLADRKGPRRVVLFTDVKTRRSLTPGMLKGKLARSKALMHIVDIRLGDSALERDDTNAFAPVAAATGGVLWHGGFDDSADSRVRAEELVRPLRLHAPKLTAPGVPNDMLPEPEELWEGEAVGLTELVSVPGGFVRLQGKLWQKSVQRTLSPDAAESKRWAALVFGQDLYSDLSEPEMMTLATYGGAVSPVTSYLAIEPGVRPSTEGIEWGMVGTGAGGGGRGIGIGLGGVGTLGRIDEQSWFKQALRRALVRCRAKSASLRIETTLDEVVDVDTLSVVPLQGVQVPVARQCLTRAGWALDLPGGFAKEHAIYPVRIAR
ncbi:MAG: VWA domain-containing protein [Polyangiaceae bacterium]|nr:VWA domain-containing protein [Myxococcales bacterium]MCB9587794.1 VWA domain-containing protein [Polyangiaceae bacterium]MCB9608743.1 VWA domain-containing protein [Polyangiaceae bacterium]